MSETLDLVHTSGAILSASILADAVSERPRRAEFAPEAFASGDVGAVSRAQHSETMETAFALACEQYEQVSAKLDELGTAELRQRWLVPLLQLLDWEPEFQRSHLRSDDGRDAYAITHLGWEGAQAPPAILIAAPLDVSTGGGKRSPHDEMQQYLNRVSGTWGVVANGRELRVLHDFHHTRLKGFVGFDLAAIFEARDYPSFRAFYRLIHRSRFVGAEAEPNALDALFEASQAQGVQIGRHLQEQVRHAIESLADGLLGPSLRDLLTDPQECRSLYHELLLVVYRILFLLYAEQRRMLPTEGLYAQTYSIASLTRIGEQGGVDRSHRDLWEGLKATFQAVHAGAPEMDVFPYNGRLFNPAITARVLSQTCENRFLLTALKNLTQVTIEGVKQRINYAELGVEELGSVYESLLSYTIRRATTPIPVDGRVVPVGGVYLAPLTTERRDLAAFYTPTALVDFILTLSLDPLIAERLEAAGASAEAREKALLDLRVCDPACGSGAFLIGAVERLAHALATERAKGEAPTQNALQHARRDALRHCIYGVDKDLFAVELCKVALWIHCAVPDMPLSFLDHRIQHGDSLVGWPLLDIPKSLPSEAYTVPSKIAQSRDPADRRLRDMLNAASANNDQLLAGQIDMHAGMAVPDIRVDFPDILVEDERLPADVERKTQAYEAYLHSPAYAKFDAAANLWAAAYFWGTEVNAPPPSALDYQRALSGRTDVSQIEVAARLLDELPAFHWPLRFPEIRARGGFDCILGNPPWEQIKLSEEEWFAPRAPEIAAMRTTERRAAIERLAETEPSLYTRWRLTQVAYDRMAEYMRNSGRFTASGHEPNTYLLFSELVADHLRPSGRAGILVKSGFALDKSASGLFSRLVNEGRVDEIHDIVNGLRGTPIFPAVAAVERFAVVALAGESDDTSLTVSVMSGSVEEAVTKPRHHMDAGVLAILAPRTRSLTSFRSESDLEVALSAHRRLPTLDIEENGDNPWGIDYRGCLYHSSGAAHLFLKREDLEQGGWALGNDGIFRRPRAEGASTTGDQATLLADAEMTNVEVALPVYEGQLINRYDHRAKDYRNVAAASRYGRKPTVPATSDTEKADPLFEIETRYWVLKDTFDARWSHVLADRTVIAIRDVGAPWTNQRSARGALIPRCPATDTLPVLLLPPENAMPFLGVFNSTTFDFLCRGHMPGAHLGRSWILDQVPAPPPGLDSSITDRVATLSLTSALVAAMFGVAPHVWDSDERHQLDIEIDALVAHSYGLTERQYAVVLDSFDVLARAQTRAHGVYRFKDDCLTAYRRLG